MKKLALVLIFGLISAVNAESVCEKKSYCHKLGNIGRYFEWYIHKECSGVWCDSQWKNRYDEDEKLSADWERKLSRCHTAEIKRSDKELLCLYMTTAITDYLKTTLTPQEIERFEKYLVKVGRYEFYESNKDDYLNALKFLKYYDKLDYDWFDPMSDFISSVESITDYNNYPKVHIKRFVYEEEIDDAFQFHKTYSDRSLSTIKNYVKSFEERGCENAGYYKEDCHKLKELKYIVQWAESRLKKSKSKEAK